MIDSTGLSGPGCSSSMGLLMELGTLSTVNSGIWDNEGRLQVLAASTCLTRRSMAHFGIHTAGMKKRTYSSSTNRTINIFHFNQQYLDDILVGWALVTPTQTMMKS